MKLAKSSFIKSLSSLFFVVLSASITACIPPDGTLPNPNDPTTGTPAPPPAVIEKDRFGFNTIWMFGALNNTPASTQAEITEGLKRLKQPIVRFPGGTIANSYHFNLPGYNGTQPGATINYIIPFTNMVAPPGEPVVAKISFVPNIAEHFQHILYKGTDDELVRENLQAMEYLLDRGLSIPMVELGNEFSLYPELFWRIGNQPLKPIDTVEEQVQILTEIRSTYTNDEAYIASHMKDGIDRLELLYARYQTEINAMMTRRGLPKPKYGVPIHTIRPGGKYYGDTRHFLKYWNTRVKAMKNIDALIPHIYLNFLTGEGMSKGIAELQGVVKEFKAFFPNRRFWYTEFNANPYLNGKTNDDTQEQVNVLTKMIQIFRENNGDYYFLHQLFTDTSSYPLMYKKLNETSKPVNGLTQPNGTVVADPRFGKSLFYSPLFCWGVKTRGASTLELEQLRSDYGCP